MSLDKYLWDFTDSGAIDGDVIFYAVMEPGAGKLERKVTATRIWDYVLAQIDGTGDWKFGNTSLQVKGTSGDKTLTLRPGSIYTVDRTLTITTGDSNRELTLLGDATLNDWFDQNVKVAASPEFAGVKLTDDSGSHTVEVVAGSTVTDDRTLTVLTGDADRTLEVAGTSKIDQDVATDATPRFASVEINDGGTHKLTISASSTFSEDRTLTLATGDANRTVTLEGNPTLSDWFDQSVKAAATPEFAGVKLTGYAEGRVLFVDGSEEVDNDGAFVWDNTNKRLGVGTDAPDSAAHVVSTTEQLRLGYDASNYVSMTVNSAGLATLDGVGASAGFRMEKALTIQTSADRPLTLSSVGLELDRTVTGTVHTANWQLLATGKLSLNYRTGGTVRSSFVFGAGVIEAAATLHPEGYKAADGTDGATADVAVEKVGGGTRTLHFQDGLYTGYTDS